MPTIKVTGKAAGKDAGSADSKAASRMYQGDIKREHEAIMAQRNREKQLLTERGRQEQRLQGEKQKSQRRLDSQAAKDQKTHAREQAAHRKSEERALANQERDRQRQGRTRERNEARAQGQAARAQAQSLREEQALSRQSRRAVEQAERTQANQARQQARQQAAESDRFGRRSFGASGGAVGSSAGMVAKVVGMAIGAFMASNLLPGLISRGALALAEPAIDVQKRGFGIGRQAGFSGGDLINRLTLGKGTTQGTEWMSQLMLTPERVLSSLESYGISPHSVGQATGLAKVFGRQNLMPGLSGMGDNAAEQLMRQRSGFTSMSGEGANRYLTSISAVMEHAISRGMDRTKVLGNIQSTLESLAGNGALGVSDRSTLDMFARFGAAGTPGGRTGESASNAIAGFSNFVNNPSSNPAGMFMAYSQVSKFGGLKTEDDVKNFIGSANWDAAGQSPKMRSMAVKDITDAARSGNPYAAFQLATQVLMRPNPGRVAELMQPGIDSAFPSYLRTFAAGGMAGNGVSSAYEMRAGAGAKAPTEPASSSLKYAAPDDYYRSVLSSSGQYDPATIEHLISSGKKKNQSPLAIAAGWQERIFGGSDSELNTNSVRDRISGMMLQAQTPAYIGQAENQASQSTIEGANVMLNTFVPAATRASSELEKFTIAVGEATRRMMDSRGTPMNNMNPWLMGPQPAYQSPVNQMSPGMQ